jgi:thiamine-phosphate pyrophosphorylase
MHLPSPGVERAVAAAQAWAVRRGSATAQLSDYALGLLDEEEGRPAGLLARLGNDVAVVRERLEQLSDATPAPTLATLYDAARKWSVRYRADPAFMTDAFLLAVLTANEGFRAAAAQVGLDAHQLAELMTGEVNSPVAWPDAPATTFDPTTRPEAAVAQPFIPASRPDEPPASFVPPEPIDENEAARILDANLNRGREALRVVEDYCRFVLNDHFLTEAVKHLRHGLAGASSQLPAGALLAARDTTGDVGTRISAGGEYDRTSSAHVVAVNLKRLQEALRSVEEYGKVFGPVLGREVELLRYRSYTLERAIVRGSDARRRLAGAQLYVLLTGSQCVAALDWTIAQAAAGGATAFQLREKTLPDAELIARARDVRRWTRQVNALFIVNDRPDIARLVGADGVHLGQDDLPVADARRIVGPDTLIGVSTHSVAQVRKAVLDGADYLGVGPTFPSRTKAFDAFPGLAFVREAAAETSLPAFALGGIGPDNVQDVVAAGLRRVAVSSTIAAADDPEAVARVLRAALDGPLTGVPPVLPGPVTRHPGQSGTRDQTDPPGER